MYLNSSLHFTEGEFLRRVAVVFIYGTMNDVKEALEE